MRIISGAVPGVSRLAGLQAELVVLPHDEGFTCSTSTVGRLLNSLKERGVLKEPILNRISARKRQRQRPYAIRKPKEYLANKPGDILEVDTLDVRPLPGIILKHFTAHDVISRWDVVSVYSRAIRMGRGI